MSNLINPNTGSSLNDEKIFQQLQAMMQYMQMQDQKIRELTAQQMHLGLFLEYTINHLVEPAKEDGEPLVAIDFKEFPAWAQERSQEIRAEAQAHMEAAKEAQAPLEVNLDDIE